MKNKLILTAIGILFFQLSAIAQWTPNTSSTFSTIGRSGNVGIGVTSGINERLHIGGNIRLSGDIRGYRSTSSSFGLFGNTAHNNGSYIRVYGPSSGQVTVCSYNSGHIRFYNYTNGWRENMRIQNDGKVIIGNASAPSSGYLLAVDQGILTEKVRVCANANSWCDYVFEDDYNLKSIYSVEKFINENKHLPNVPSASEVEENGINVAEMDATLLRQIEELWLHVINLKKENDALKAELNKLKK